MEPASSIIERLGGVKEVAAAVGIHRTRVSNWKRPRDVGGTHGRVPQDHHPKLLALALEKGIPLSAADFLPVHDAPSGPVSSSACGSEPVSAEPS